MRTQQLTPTRWIVDPMHSTVAFSARHLLITHVHGCFEGVRGMVRYDRQRPARTELRIEIAAASVHSRQPQRDEHLRGADFLDVESYPSISFQSTRAEVVDGCLEEIVGALSLRGVTRDVILTVHEISDQQLDHHGKRRIGASATTRIRRSDFGMTYNVRMAGGGLAVSDEVRLRFDVSLVEDVERG